MEWKDRIVRSDSFDNPSGHQNPNSMSVESYTREANVVKVGAFSLSKGKMYTLSFPLFLFVPCCFNKDNIVANVFQQVFQLLMLRLLYTPT